MTGRPRSRKHRPYGGAALAIDLADPDSMQLAVRSFATLLEIPHGHAEASQNSATIGFLVVDQRYHAVGGREGRWNPAIEAYINAQAQFTIAAVALGAVVRPGESG